MLIVGTTDKAKQFHPCGLAMCCNEKDEAFEFIFNSIKDSVKEIYNFNYEPTILIAYASDAITNVFKSVFGEFMQRVMCWFHMKKAYEDHESFTAINSQHKENIRQDIYLLQLSNFGKIT